MRRINYGEIVRELLERSGGNQTALAKRLGTTQPTISRWLSDNQEPEKANHARILQEAQELGIVTAVENVRQRTVPVVGYVQAGGEAILYADGQGPFDEAGMPPKGASEYTVAVVVRGNSMAGLADDGWLLYYDTRREPPTDELMGKLCVVGLADGRVVVKKLLRGSRDGMYHLISVHGDPMIDQAVKWAARVSWIEPQ